MVRLSRLTFNWKKGMGTIALFLMLNGLFAQSSEVGNWFIYFGNQAINKRWNWWNEVQYRNYNLIGDLQQLLLRTGIGYNLSPSNNNVLAGYAYIDTRNYLAGTSDKNKISEHRLYQQFITRQQFSRFYTQHRYRLEERMIGDQWQWRFRYFLSLNVPLNAASMQKGTIYASVYNEIFLNMRRPQFDRNRLYGGLGYVFSKNFRTELAVMNQMTEKSRRWQLQLVVFNSLPLHNAD